MTRQRMQNSGAERARWLAELAAALETARSLAARLGADPIACRTATALHARLTLAIAEVETLRRGGAWRPGREVYPKKRPEFPPARRTHFD